MAPYFGVQEDGGEWAQQRYKDYMKDLSLERGDEVGECL
jgi:hypothetical protein